ncbi:hypothetical protein [Paludisphaera sp.]|uniref:hypothetical protein n=1 Tax=Paludisphaera sp. TaxID=2017432 RepID=UPI00301DFD59
MSPSSIYRGPKAGAGILLALVAWLALAPAAGAHCGSRAMSGASASLDPSAGLEVVALGAESSPLDPPPTPACEGASCSGRAPAPLPGRGFETIPSRGDGMAEAVATAHPPASSRRPRVVDETLDDPRAPSGIFHPPRRPS